MIRGSAHSRRVNKATGSQVTISTMGGERVRDHGDGDGRLRVLAEGTEPL